jgi:hypothetical protein
MAKDPYLTQPIQKTRHTPLIQVKLTKVARV